MSRTRHTGARTGIELWTESLTGTDLVRDYLSGDRKLASFFAGFPFDPGAYQWKADAVHARLGSGARARIADALQPTTAAAAAKMARVLGGEGLAVTTGQQAGLFGGPLYTFYKILTAIDLAARLEVLLRQPVIPVFWIAADDHDWAEVNHTYAVDSQNELQRIDLGGEDGIPVPMSERRLGPHCQAALEGFLSGLPASEFALPLDALLRASYRPDASMARAFGDLLRGLFAEFDLVLVDPAHPSLKQAAAPLLMHDLSRTERGNGRLEQQTSRLVAAGYHEQVNIAPEAANVFLSDEAGRDRLTRENGSWLLRRTRRSLSGRELQALLESEPARFSPNVLLRPVVESALIPTVAYVGGPAEIGYFAQIGCLFNEHNVDPPLVVPRCSVTVVEGKVRKVLDKFGLEPREVMRPFHELATQIIRDELPDAVRNPLARLRGDLVAGYDALAEGATIVDPTLKPFILSARNNALNQVDTAEKKLTSHLKKKSEVELDQLRKAAVHLYPGGSLQERTLNALPFLARYGPGLMHDLAAAIQVRIDRPNPGWTGVLC